MTIIIENCESNNNGRDGFRIERDDVRISNCSARGNGGQGFNIIRSQSVLEQIGLPSDTDPREVAHLLTLLRTKPADQKQDFLENNGIFQHLKSFVMDTTTLAANLITISADPRINAIVQALIS